MLNCRTMVLIVQFLAQKAVFSFKFQYIFVTLGLIID